MLAAVLISAAALGPVPPAAGEQADVYLKSGLKLRGDVTRSGQEIILRNPAGELRLRLDDVARIVPVGSAGTRPATQPVGPPSDEPRPELPPVPLLSNADVQRLKLHELRLDGPPEQLQVRFLRKGKQRDLAVEVLERLRQAGQLRPAWEEILARGQPYEKLQLIVRCTGDEYADRIVIEGDPAVFRTFRRDVLPLLTRGCARSGCHGGTGARVFRLPSASARDNAVYTAFVLLDQMETEHGPLLDRNSPEDSVLLSFLLSRKATERGHPPVAHGPPFKAVIPNRNDRRYEAVRAWIASLAVPHPDYGLEYHNPYAGRSGRPPQSQPATQPASPANHDEP